MARPIKVSIVNPDRTTSVYYVKKQQMIGHNAFRLKGTDEIYVIDPKYSVITITKRLGMPFRYTTYYYKRNVPQTVNWVEVSGDKVSLELQDVKNKKGVIVASAVTAMAPIKAPDFDNAVWKGITSKELGQLLNPEFLRMISRAAKDKRNDMQFYLQVGTAGGVAFLIYYVMQNLPKAIAAALGHK